ncbi:BACON domain-containing protein [uncultured Odoribacter sp.]|uniref:BACON domain-containing protein n=1 Tax=uncultured Odoribacter sp. TaxID=876416 RepID=UPI00260BB806|nr:BACON domain-containing protein [uncultured Odoribacter sp.]
MKTWHLIFCFMFLVMTWHCSDDEKPAPVEIPKVTLGQSDILLPTRGGSVEIAVETGGTAWYVKNEPEWLTVSEYEGRMLLIAENNFGGQRRSATLTVCAEGGPEDTQATLNITQNNGAMVLCYEAEKAGATVKLPVEGRVKCKVDWGDGQREEIDAVIDGISVGYPSHTYEVQGTYQVEIAGTVTALSSILLDEDQRARLRAVEVWGETGLEKMEYAFNGCTSLLTLASNSENAFAKVTTFRNAFNGCSSLKEIPADLFAGCTQATDFSLCFTGCVSLKEIPAHLLDECTAIEKINSIFSYCKGLEIVPEGLFISCGRVADFSYTFIYCEALQQIPANLFAPCTEALTFQHCFAGNIVLKEIPEGLFDQCKRVEIFQSTFLGCTSLTGIPEGLFDQCTEAEKFNFAFADCENLSAVPVSLFDFCRKATRWYGIFRGCSVWKGESPYTLVGDKKVHLYERGEYPNQFTAPIEYKTAFKECSLLEDYAVIANSYPQWL